MLKGRIRRLENVLNPDSEDPVLCLCRVESEDGGMRLTKRSERLLGEAKKKDPWPLWVSFHLAEMSPEFQAEELKEEPELARFLGATTSGGNTATVHGLEL